ncbi:efflux RND transporter periplasmic adaptor subunit [Phyllobacterium sp. YR531]|uniref:efflux RND transporter periplasmic adaptor subunit n=1 Tax=Phyllobacterium sp. YR531 TaxID=1144343 RepID=UPI00026FBA58|nr:efflux RND transporter periplasmic adaptor subunit [Phyllobacterium sp. YR531]EJN06753.1 RND family efflux transporter, MFP subunit [Phyllobacterium sp. YR531]
MRRQICFILTIYLCLVVPSAAQMPGGAPPAVGVVTVKEKGVTESVEFNGRVEAVDHVNIVARISAFLDEQLFKEGSHVKKGDLLFRLERPPFEADVEAKRAALEQAQATLENANLAFGRADQLRNTGSGTQSALDNATAAKRSAQAQVRAAEAALHTSEINLSYTAIKAPVDGRIGRAVVTVGNVVSPSSGTLVTIVSQDPMYVTFPVPTSKIIELRDKYAALGGTEKALRLRLRLPDGRVYEPTGRLDFTDISVAQNTDSITLRGTIPNPLRSDNQRGLFNDQFVRVVLEAVMPQQALSIPRGAVLTDQQGDFVYVVNEKSVAEIRRIKLGQSSAESAVVLQGLKLGETIVAEGAQRVRPLSPVTPEPIAEQTASRR